MHFLQIIHKTLHQFVQKHNAPTTPAAHPTPPHTRRSGARTARTTSHHIQLQPQRAPLPTLPSSTVPPRSANTPPPPRLLIVTSAETDSSTAARRKNERKTYPKAAKGSNIPLSLWNPPFFHCLTAPSSMQSSHPSHRPSRPPLRLFLRPKTQTLPPRVPRQPFRLCRLCLLTSRPPPHATSRPLRLLSQCPLMSRPPPRATRLHSPLLRPRPLACCHLPRATSRPLRRFHLRLLLHRTASCPPPRATIRIRPIGIPSALRRVPTKPLATDAAKCWGPRLRSAGQHGSGLSAGVDTVPRALQLILEHNPTFAVNSEDCVNAFNELLRAIIIEVLEKEDKVLLQQYIAYYQKDVPQYFRLSNGSLQHIPSQRGGIQGDALFSIIFKNLRHLSLAGRSARHEDARGVETQT